MLFLRGDSTIYTQRFRKRLSIENSCHALFANVENPNYSSTPMGHDVRKNITKWKIFVLEFSHQTLNFTSLYPLMIDLINKLYKSKRSWSWSQFSWILNINITIRLSYGTLSVMYDLRCAWCSILYGLSLCFIMLGGTSTDWLANPSTLML